MASAPHGGEESPYPASLRPGNLDSDWFPRLCADAAIRFLVDDRPITFDDRALRRRLALEDPAALERARQAFAVIDGVLDIVPPAPLGGVFGGPAGAAETSP